MTFVTDQMENALVALQNLPRTPDRLEDAYYRALSGTTSLRPDRSEVAAEMMTGKLLALDVWREGMMARHGT